MLLVSIPFSAGQRLKAIVNIILTPKRTYMFLSLFQQGKDLKTQPGHTTIQLHFLVSIPFSAGQRLKG